VRELRCITSDELRQKSGGSAAIFFALYGGYWYLGEDKHALLTIVKSGNEQTEAYLLVIEGGRQELKRVRLPAFKTAVEGSLFPNRHSLKVFADANKIYFVDFHRNKGIFTSCDYSASAALVRECLSRALTLHERPHFLGRWDAEQYLPKFNLIVSPGEVMPFKPSSEVRVGVFSLISTHGGVAFPLLQSVWRGLPLKAYHCYVDPAEPVAHSERSFYLEVICLGRWIDYPLLGGRFLPEADPHALMRRHMLRQFFVEFKTSPHQPVQDLPWEDQRE
jgi:hypothetical protein